MQTRKLRTVREEPKFIDQFEALGISHRRLDVVLDSAYFALSRDPESFPIVPGTQLRVVGQFEISEAGKK